MVDRQKGLTLIEIIMSLGILSIALVAIMQLNSNTVNNRISNFSQIEYVQMTGEILSLLTNGSNCNASFIDPISGTGAIGINRLEFEASTIQEFETNGLEIELWTGRSADFNTRSRLRFKESIKYRNLLIDSVVLYLPAHNSGNLPLGVGQLLQAEVIIQGKRRINLTDYISFIKVRVPVDLVVNTDNVGLSSVVACSI